MYRAMLLPLAAVALAAPALAQTDDAPATGSPGGLGSLGGLLGGGLGGGLPSVAGVGTGNAAGVIGYCVKNNYLKGANASSILGKLTGRQGVTRSPGYAAGQSGVVQAGSTALPLANLQDQVKTKLCDAVLKHGAALLMPR